MQTNDSLTHSGNSDNERINKLSVYSISLDSLVEYDGYFIFCVINDVINFSGVRFESCSEFSKPMISVVFLLVGFLLFFFSGLFLFLGTPAILFKTKFGLHDKPKNRKQYGKSQLNSTYHPHDKLIMVVVVREVRGLLNRIMVHNDKIKHKRTDEIGNISCSFSDAIHNIWSDRKVVFPSILSERFQLQVI